MDAITLLVEDHDRIDSLFESLRSGDVTAIPLVCEAVLVHSRLESEVLYPVAARVVRDEDWDVSAALDEHVLMRRLIRDLSDSFRVGPAYLSKAAELMSLVRQHVQHDESGLFRRVKEAMSPAELRALGALLEEVRESARSARPPGARGDRFEDAGAGRGEAI